jgi:hypothetical protein
MGLLDGGLASVFASAFSTFYLDATLHRSTITDDGRGGGSVAFEDEAVKAQLDSTSHAMREAEGYVEGDQRIFVLASGLAAISTDDEITIGEQRWMIQSVATDPAGAYFELRGRKSPREGS